MTSLDSATLTRLRAFEAVGRHLSFSRAAVELGVTPTALSHSVRHLEQALGTALLTRLHRRIELTPTGAQLLGECTRGLHTLATAVDDVVRRAAEHRVLTLSVAPYFSARWLVPRLAHFWNAHPGIELRLQHAYQAADFTRDRVDAGIGWGTGRSADVEAELVVRGELTPLCSPAVADRLPTRPRPRHLARWRLCYEFDPGNWTQWFAAAGSKLPVQARIVEVDDSHALRKIAIDGEGVALFFVALSEEDVRTGQLVRPFPQVVDPGSAYWFTRPRGPLTPALAAFREWLLDEIALDPTA